ncbi:hypothetical protein EDC94DRAFT_697893 [Helicostylum pulchrum]|nr:hypothetical protein EDC94DRAFT_697893 [Helicostylum pulchrum]
MILFFLKQSTSLALNREFTNENSENLKEDLEKLYGLEICYTDDSNKPMLQTKLKVNDFPSYYHRYKDDLPKSTNLQEQIIFKTTIPEQSISIWASRWIVGMYEQKQISMKQIYSETVVITDLFD